MQQNNSKTNWDKEAKIASNPENRVTTLEQVPSALSYLINRFNVLEQMIVGSEAKPITQTEPKYIYSIRGLADFLNCSTVTAQKLKSEGRIKYRQIGRKVIFETSEVIKAMENHVPGNRARKKQTI